MCWIRGYGFLKIWEFCGVCNLNRSYLKAENADFQTVQLLLPLAAPNEQERTLYLCVRSGSQWKPMGSRSKFTLPKVTMTQVLNEEDEYILEDSNEDHGKFKTVKNR